MRDANFHFDIRKDWIGNAKINAKGVQSYSCEINTRNKYEYYQKNMHTCTHEKTLVKFLVPLKYNSQQNIIGQRIQVVGLHINENTL